MKNTKIQEIYNAVEKIFNVHGGYFENQIETYKNYTLEVYSKKIHIKKETDEGSFNGVFIVSDDPNVKGEESNIQIIVKGARHDGSRLITRFGLSNTVGEFFEAWKNCSYYSLFGLNEKILAEIELVVYSFIEDHVKKI